MNVFGPKYPSALQVVVNHAERFCEMLSRHGRNDAAPMRRAEVWPVGRSREIETVLTLLLVDWAEGRVALDAAAASATAYLAELHAGLRVNLGLGAPLACCKDEQAKTVLVGEAVTRVLGRAPLDPQRLQAPRRPDETWFDPAGVVREVFARREEMFTTDPERKLADLLGKVHVRNR